MRYVSNQLGVVVFDHTEGYNAADINFDSKVDGADLGQVLGMQGDAPRQDLPPATCPLNLIKPAPPHFKKFYCRLTIPGGISAA